MSGQQQPPRYGHGGHGHSHGHARAHDGNHPNGDNAGGTGGYADIDDETAMLGYPHHLGTGAGRPSLPLDEYRYPDLGGGGSISSAAAAAGDRQYYQRLFYLQQHQHQQRVVAAQAQAQAHAAAAAAAAATGAYGPPDPMWHAQLHLHHHHPPGYGRHMLAHAARYAPYTSGQYGPPPPPNAARRSATGSPMLAKDQQHQHHLHVLKSPSASASAMGSDGMPLHGPGGDGRSHRSGSQRSTHLTTSHRSPSVSSSSKGPTLGTAAAAAAAASAAVAPAVLPASARIQHPAFAHHHHHPLPPRPRVHHTSALKHTDSDTTLGTPNGTGGTTSDSNGYRYSGSGGDASPDSSSLSAAVAPSRMSQATAASAASSSGAPAPGVSSNRARKNSTRDHARDRAQSAAESRSTAAHEGSATSAEESTGSSSDPARVPPSTTSSSDSSTNTKTQSATSSAPETVPDPPPEPPLTATSRATARVKPAAPSPGPAVKDQVTPSKPTAALQLTKDRAWAQSLVEQVSDMVLSLAPNGTIVWASPSARKVVGFTAAELAGRHLGEFVHPEDAQLLTRKLTASIAQSTGPVGDWPSGTALPDSSFDVTVRFRRKNADYYLLHITGRALLVNGPQVREAIPEYPGVNLTALRSPPSADLATFPPVGSPPTQPIAPPPLGVPSAPGIGLHPFALPYNPGNLMAAAAALATATPFDTVPSAAAASVHVAGGLASATKHPRPPPLLVAVCREYPLGDHAAQLDGVVDLRFENELLRERLTGAYERKGHSPPPDSALRLAHGGAASVKLTDIVLPKANGVATAGPLVPVPPGAPNKGLSVAVVPSDILRVAVEKGVVPKAAADVAESAVELDDSSAGVGKGKGRARKKRKHNGIHPSDERVCIDCGVTSSSEWRKGPLGAKTLCNACGLRYAKRKKDEAAARAKAMLADTAAPSADSAGNGDPAPPSSGSSLESAGQSTALPSTSTSEPNGSSSATSGSSSPPTTQVPAGSAEADTQMSNT